MPVLVHRLSDPPPGGLDHDLGLNLTSLFFTCCCCWSGMLVSVKSLTVQQVYNAAGFWFIQTNVSRWCREANYREKPLRFVFNFCCYLRFVNCQILHVHNVFAHKTIAVLHTLFISSVKSWLLFFYLRISDYFQQQQQQQLCRRHISAWKTQSARSLAQRDGVTSSLFSPTRSRHPKLRPLNSTSLSSLLSSRFPHIY